MATYTFLDQEYDAIADFIPDLARWLVNDLAGESGPGYTIIDTYCAAAATPHEVPGTATDMDSLAADNGWRTGTIGINDYIILQDQTGTHQIGIEYQAATTIKFIGAPTKGFVTGNDDNDMAAAGNWGNATLTAYTLAISSANVNSMSVVASENHFKIMRDPLIGVTYYWTYVGELEDAHTTDGYTMVVWDETIDTYAYASNAPILKLSDVNGTTVLSCYNEMPNFYSNAFTQVVNGTDRKNKRISIAQIGVGSITASHYGVFGRLQGVYSCSYNSIARASKGTFADVDGNAKAFRWWVATTGTYGPIIFDCRT